MSTNIRPYGARLRTERARLGLSQAQLAEASGLSKATQVSYENDQHVPTLEYADNVEAAGIDKIYLCTGISEAKFVASRFDWELHREIISRIFAHAEEHDLEIPPAKISDLVHLLFEEFVSTKTVEPTKLIRALRLVA